MMAMMCRIFELVPVRQWKTQTYDIQTSLRALVVGVFVARLLIDASTIFDPWALSPFNLQLQR